MDTPPVGSAEWAALQIRAYAALHARYVRYAATLRELLELVLKDAGLSARVSARAKTVVSFGEKIQRKRDKYSDPVDELTDLCGARIVVFGANERASVCRTLRACDLFWLDERNSEDEHERLGAGSFGYRSAHFIVQLDREHLAQGFRGLTIADDLFPRLAATPRESPMKAEIQVRTVLEDAWATFTHDRAYKGDARPPETWQRELNSISAALESADNAFARLERDLPQFESSDAQAMSPAQIAQRRALLETVAAELEPRSDDRAAVALTLGRLAAAQFDWRRVVEDLQDFAGAPGALGREIAVELARARCALGLSNGADDELAQGRESLSAVAQVSFEAIQNGDVAALPEAIEAHRTPARAAHLLARSLETTGRRTAVVKRLHDLAHAADPSNPYFFAGYLEHELSVGGNEKLVDWSRGLIENALATCRLHSEIGIESPWAHFTRGFLLLVTDRPFEALSAYAKGIRTSALDWQLKVASDSLDGVRGNVSQSKALDCALQLLRAGQLAKFGGGAPARAAEQLERKRASQARRAAPGPPPFARPVTIVAGGTNASLEKEMAKYLAPLADALRGLRGTVISGGTTSGIAGLVGAAKAQLAASDEATFRLVGYVPEFLPNTVTRDMRYDELRTAPGADFGPDQIVQYWIDLLLDGVRASGVRVLGINGGPIAELEYQIALALGAKVAVVAPSGRAVAALQSDAQWKDDPGLTGIANAADLTGFLLANEDGEALFGGDAVRIEQIAEAIHSDFLAQRRHNTDAAMQPWTVLRNDFKDSNRGQARAMCEILWRAGFDVRPATGASDAVTEFESAEIERMAALEHERWRSERWASGWRYATQRDEQRKLSPYLVPYEALTDDVKRWDRDAVKNYPSRLKLAAMEIVRRKPA